MEELILRPVYLWAFQSNREQLRLLQQCRYEKSHIIPQPIYDIDMNNKQRNDLLMKSHLAVILSKKLVGNIRYPSRHAQRILTQQHYFQDMKCVATMEQNRNSFLSFAFHPTEPILATGSDDWDVKLWRLSDDSSTMTRVKNINVGFSVSSIVFHSTLPILVTGCDDRSTFLWRLSPDCSKAKYSATLLQHTEGIWSIAFHPTALIMATGSGDSTAKLWRLSPNGSAATCVQTIKHTGIVFSVEFHSTAPILVTCSVVNTVKLWKLSSDFSAATCIVTLEEHDSFAFHPTELIFATGSNNTVKLWRMSPGDWSPICMASLAGHSGCILSVVFHPTLPIFVTSSSDRTVKFWILYRECSSATCVSTLDEYSNNVTSAIFHPKRPILATLSNDKVKLWK